MSKLRAPLSLWLDRLGRAWDYLVFWFSHSGRTWISVCLGLFLVSLLSFLFLPLPRDLVLLKFPDDAYRGFRYEYRLIPRVKGREAKANALASELLLGPCERGAQAYFDRGTTVHACMIRKGVLYLDLSEDMAANPPPDSCGPRAVSAFSSVLRRNLPGISSVVLTVGGQIPYEAGEVKGLSSPGEKKVKAKKPGKSDQKKKKSVDK